VEILSKVLIENHELADAERGEQEGNSQAGGVNGEEQDAAGDGVAGGGESENGGEIGPMQGVQPKANAKPRKKPLQMPGWVALVRRWTSRLSQRAIEGPKSR